LKITLASAGTAIAGTAAGVGGQALLLAAAAITAAAVLVAVGDRMMTRRARPAKEDDTVCPDLEVVCRDTSAA
uniref:hypothetical protein n=1 Tax=Sphaerisporangium fuscum TaxID=2835868 RepID=UPI001BDD0B52